jgi:hypothetical protein
VEDHARKFGQSEPWEGRWSQSQPVGASMIIKLRARSSTRHYKIRELCNNPHISSEDVGSMFSPNVDVQQEDKFCMYLVSYGVLTLLRTVNWEGNAYRKKQS